MEAAISGKFAETIRTNSETLLGFHGIAKPGEKYFLLQFLGVFHRQYVKIASNEAHLLGFGICLPLYFNFSLWIGRIQDNQHSLTRSFYLLNCDI
jgi:hypothetical protein